MQAGDADAAAALVSRFGPYIKNIARRRNRHLSRDLLDETVQETYQYLLDPTRTAFDPTHCSAKQYVGGVAYNAAKHINQVYRNGPAGAEWVADEVTVLDEQPSPTAASEQADVEYRLLLWGTLRQADPVTQRVVVEHYYFDRDVGALATALGLSRFQVYRRLNAFRTSAQAA